MIEFYYWKPKVSEPAGHVGIKLDDVFYTFWPIVVRPDDTRGPVPGFINTDEQLEHFVAGLRKLALQSLIDVHKRLPSGIKTYQIIYEHFDAIKQADDAVLVDFFKSLDPQARILEDQRDKVIDASVELAKWIKNTSQSRDAIIKAGAPDQIIALTFLEQSSVIGRIEYLQLLQENLMWYAKVGAKTDRELNAGNHMWIPNLFASKMSGLQYYNRDKVRHNCASFILDILRSGDHDHRFSYYNESSEISSALQSNIRLNAASKNEVPNAQDLSSAEQIKHLHLPLRLMGYGQTPISDWFGTTPAILASMIDDAVAHANYEQHSTCCLM